MGTPIDYRSLYQIVASAADLKSGKKITNTYYFRSGIAGAGAPAPDSPIAGSDIDVFLLNFDTQFSATIMQKLSVNYKQQISVCRKIVGWKYNNPFYPITGVTPLLVGTGFQIGGVLPFTTSNFVSIQGVTGATAANGIWTATATSLNTFTTNANTTGTVWTGGGSMQGIDASNSWLYTTQASLAVSAVGFAAGEALPLFSDVSGRRLGSTAGKSFQGRNSYAPIPEADQLNGKLESTALTAWTTNLTAFNAGIANGAAAGDGRDTMYFYNASFKLGLTQASPFSPTSVDNITSLVGSQFPQPNLGSLVKRKPRLTATIS